MELRLLRNHGCEKRVLFVCALICALSKHCFRESKRVTEKLQLLQHSSVHKIN